MRNSLRDHRIIALCAAALIAACSTVATKSRDTIVFSHYLHAEQGVGCTDCHGEITEDAERKIQAVPRMTGCADCHDVESDDGCGTCHTDTDNPETYPAELSTHLVFSHQIHQERTSDCADCHADAASTAQLGDGQRLVPQHPECNTCHQPDMDAGRCQLCHDRLDLYQRKPETVYSHGEGFFEKHGLQAAAGGAEHCALCHDQSFCGDCHARTMTVRPSLRYPDRVDRSFVHQGDWISRHVIEARSGDTGCLKCHGTSFCSSCHEQGGVGGLLGQRNPHPASWLMPNTAESHSRAARRNIVECAACHDQGPASNCLRCHRAGGGHNPHPPGWKAPVPASERTSHKMCSLCHSY